MSRTAFKFAVVVLVSVCGFYANAEEGKTPKVSAEIPDAIMAFEETVAKIQFPEGAEVVAKLMFAPKEELKIQGNELHWTPTSSSVGKKVLTLEATIEGRKYHWRKEICVRRPTLPVGFAIMGGMLSEDGKRGVVWGSPGTLPRPPFLELAVFGWMPDSEVDAVASAAISQSILKHSLGQSIVCAATFGDQVYVVSKLTADKPDTDWTLQAFRLPDFEIVAIQQIGTGATELRIIAGRYLVAVGAKRNAILRLPDLQPMPDDKVVNPEQSGRLGNGWLLDCLLYDDALSKPQLLAPLRLSERTPRSGQRIEPFRGLVSRTEGAALGVIVPPVEKRRFGEDVHSIPSFEVLADLAIDNDALFLIRPGAKQVIQGVSVAYATLQSLLPGEDMLSHLRKKYTLLDVAPKRALVSHGDEALVVSTDDMNYFESTATIQYASLSAMQIEPRQSVFAFELDQPKTLQYHSAGAVNFQLSIVDGDIFHHRLMEMESKDGSFHIDLKALETELRRFARSLVLSSPDQGVAHTTAESASDNPRSKAVAKRLELKRQRESLDRYNQRVSPLLSRLRVDATGRIALPLIVSVIANNAVGERCAMQHSVFVLVPLSFLNEPPQPEPASPSKSAPVVRLPDLSRSESAQATVVVPDLPSGGTGTLHAPTFIGPAFYTGIYSPTISWRKVENATAYRLVVQHEGSGEIMLDTMVGVDPETNNPSVVYTNESQRGGMHRCAVASVDRFGEAGQFCAPRRFYCGAGEVRGPMPSTPANPTQSENGWAVFDDQGPHLELIGNWRSVKNPKAMGGDLQMIEPGEGESVAKWHIPATVGRYEIQIAWPESQEYAHDARFTVRDGNEGQFLTSTDVDLTKAPVGEVDSGGRSWHKLSVDVITTDGIVIQVSDLADGMVALDAVRVRSFQR